MGYEGHLMREPAEAKAAQVEASMAVLLAAGRTPAAMSCPPGHRYLRLQPVGHRA